MLQAVLLESFGFFSFLASSFSCSIKLRPHRPPLSCAYLPAHPPFLAHF
jgi:hypothetical protein